jgi:hypothetical protein
MNWLGESGDLSVSMMFRLASLASIHLISIELEIVFIPFWGSRDIHQILLPSVKRTLRDRLLPRIIGFPFEKGAKEPSTSLLDFIRLKTEVKRSNGLETTFLPFSIFA